MHTDTNLDPLRRALAARCETIAEHLLGPPSHRAPAELRWGRRGSLGLATAGPRRGLWHDHERGEGGDLIALIQRERRCGFREAVRLARELTGEPDAPPPRRDDTPPPRRDDTPPPQPATPPPPRDTARLAERIWREAMPARGTLVERYLASRGLRLPEPPDDPDAIRYHAACPRGAERLPAMVALMTCPARNTPTGVHRTFLRADGTDRLRDERGKAMLGRAGVIRLSPDSEVTLGLGLAEGIETGLAVIQHLDWRPVWVAGSAGGIAAFPVLPGVESLTIFADCDPAGQRAAETCAHRWAEARREAVIITPPRGDWADRPEKAA